MCKLVVIIFYILVIAGNASAQNDSCSFVKEKLTGINTFVNHSVFRKALQDIAGAAKIDVAEHCIAFAQDSIFGYAASKIANGNRSSGKVPGLGHAFCDLHNHTNNLPPDAGDVYGLISLCKMNPNYTTRFVITANSCLYLLLITNRDAAISFALNNPPQPPAAEGLQPTFPEKIVDKCRELKYVHQWTDEQVINYILKKYNSGILILSGVKSDDNEFLFFQNSSD